jgi:hypothetical protein
MKKLHIGLNFLFYFLYFLGSCILAMLVEALLVFFIEKFVALPYPVLTIIRIVIYTAGITALLSVLGYSEGFREASCSVGGTVTSGVLASVLHLLFAMLFKFQGFVSGGVRFLAGLIHNGWDITYDSLINETPYLLFVAVCLGYSALYITALTVSKWLGAQKRIISRAELRMGEDTPSESPSDESFY